jgi:hypothetical protein
LYIKTAKHLNNFSIEGNKRYWAGSAYFEARHGSGLAKRLLQALFGKLLRGISGFFSGWLAVANNLLLAAP